MVTFVQHLQTFYTFFHKTRFSVFFLTLIVCMEQEAADRCVCVSVVDRRAIRRLHPRQQSRHVYDTIPLSVPALPASSPIMPQILVHSFDTRSSFSHSSADDHFIHVLKWRLQQLNYGTEYPILVCLCGSLAQCALSLKRLSAGLGSIPRPAE